MAHHLVQIIPKPDQLSVNQPRIIVGGNCRRGFDAGVQQQRAAEMNRAHADRAGAPRQIVELACRQAEIELPVARL